MIQHDDDRLSAYLDDELDTEERAAFEAELEADEGLRRSLEGLRQVRGYVRRHGQLTAPRGFAHGVVDALDEAPGVADTPWWRRPFGVPLAGYVAVAMAALVLFAVLPEAPEPPVAPAMQEVRFEAIQPTEVAATYMAPDGYRLVLAAGSDAAAVLAAVEAEGGLARGPDGAQAGADPSGAALTVTLPAPAVARLRMQLGELGTVEALGTPRVVTGEVTLRLELVATP